MRSITLALAILASASWYAAAQEPQQTTATFSDWTLRCVMAGTAKSKTCEVVQSASVQGQAAPISEVAIGRADKASPMKIVVHLPANVWVPAHVKVIFDRNEKPIEAALMRCIPLGCFAEASITDEQVKKMRAAKSNGTIDFEDGARKKIALPLSPNGLGAALDAMAKE